MSTGSDTMTLDGYCSDAVFDTQALQSFKQRLASRAAETEKLGKVHPDSVQEAALAGYFHSLVPQRWGGRQGSFRTFLETTREMAQGCTSSAWSLSFLALHAWLLCKFEPRLQEELFANGQIPLAPAPLAPVGKAVACEGGFRVTGRWEWATGVMHSDWVMVSCTEAQTPGPLFCVLPTREVVIEDNWHVSGMAGTGSNAIRVEDVFVPKHRTMMAALLKFGKAPGEAIHDYPTMSYSIGATLALVACTPALGTAEAALEAYRSRMQDKIMAYSGARQGDMPMTHFRLGEAKATLTAAQLVWRNAISDLEQIGPLGLQAPVQRLVDIRLAAADVVRLSNLVANAVAAAAGASSGYSQAPLQRHLRDLQMIRGHVVFDWDRTAQLAGKVAMGVDPDPTDLL